MRRLLSLLPLLACAPPEPPEVPGVPDTGEQEMGQLQLDPSTRPALLTLSLAEPEPAIPRGAELSGLVTGLLELGLADLDGVVPEVAGVAPSPGLAGLLRADLERWTLATRLWERERVLTVEATLCTAGGVCQTHAALATRAEPTPAIATIVEAVAAQMARGEDAGSGLARAEPQSDDPYAVLLAGRSAATWYGLLPPTPENLLGHKRRDPVSRALLVDPDTALGNWVAGRRALALGDAEQARTRFATASFARPSSTLLLADEAAALTAAGHAETAWFAWQTVLARRPLDPRFVRPAAEAALRAGLPGEAETLLALLGEPWASRSEVLSLRARAQEALGYSASDEHDQLLARWAELAPEDPEPVRRRLHNHVRAAAYEEALALAAELARRGRAAEAAEVELALLNALGRPAEGAEKARLAGQPEAAARLRARASADPAERAAALAQVPGPRAAATRAQTLLELGRADEANTLVTSALQDDPWLPEALEARAGALAAAGQAEESRRALARRCESDPALAGCGSR